MILENIYPTGINFEIELQSKLLACDSCKRFLAALVELAESEGKTIKIKYIAHEFSVRPENFRSITSITKNN